MNTNKINIENERKIDMKEEFYDGMNSQSQGEVNAAHEQSQDFNQGRPQEVAPIQENKSQEQNVYPQERMPGEEQ